MASSAPAPAPTLSCGGAHDAQAQLPHIVIFSFMAKGHTIPLTDLTHLLRRRQLATVTFLATPGNAAFVRAALAGADGVAIVELPFTDNLTDSGAPPRAECVEALDSMSSLPAFGESVSQLRPRFEEALAALRPPASAVVADAFLYWAPAPRPRRTSRRWRSSARTCSRTSPGRWSCPTTRPPCSPAPPLRTTPCSPCQIEFPHVQLTLADIPFPFNDPATTGPIREIDAKVGYAIANSDGLIGNAGDGRAARRIQLWSRHVGPRAWPVGPLCLAQTAPEAPWHWHGDVAKPAWMRWLDEKATAGRAVLYVALGTLVAVPGSELREVADGL